VGEGTGEFEAPVVDTAAEAVGDAMMAAQAQLMSEVTANPEKYFKPGIDPQRRTETILQVLSSGMCEAASIYSLYFLSQKYPEEFESLGIIKTFSDKNGTDGKLKQAFDEYHAYFIAKDKKGVWYAGSPANYDSDQTDSALTRVFKSPYPEEIIKRIIEHDGGIWPTGDFIEQAFSGPAYSRPFVGKSQKYGDTVLNAFRITNKQGQIEAKMEELSLLAENIEPKAQTAPPQPPSPAPAIK
jgi:hypothetical protein